MIRIYRTPVVPEEDTTKKIRQRHAVRQLVATFQSIASDEANAAVNTFKRLSDPLSMHGHPLYQQYRYSIEVDPPKIRPVTDDASLQISLDKARPTKRFITYQLSWEVLQSGGKCRMLAFTTHYGTVRGLVDNTVEARQFFVRRLTAIWPNATQSKH